MGPIAGIYLAVMIMTMIVAGFIFIEADFKDRKVASRMILIAPVWPLIAPIFLIKAFRWFWKRADWKGAEEDEYEERRSGRGHW